MNKYEHVAAATQTRSHHCHWPGCGKQCKPAHWGCALHWFKLPRDIRNELWCSYRAGQEEDGRPSARYIKAAMAAQLWIQLEGIPREQSKQAREDGRKQVRKEGRGAQGRSDQTVDTRAVRQSRIQRPANPHARTRHRTF